MTLIALFAFILLHAVEANTVTKAAPIFSLTDALKQQIAVLKDHGKTLLNDQKKFNEAAQCYSAILQLVEGAAGDDAYEMRRRCGLNLAFCDIKEGNYKAAVARCSEVIDESMNYLLSPPEESSVLFDRQLKESLATAHERRAAALKNLKKVDFAEIDLKKAFKYGGKSLKVKKKELYMKVKKLRFPESTEDLLRDFAEECQVSHPRINLSKTTIKQIINRHYASLQVPSMGQDMFGGGAGGIDLGSLMGGANPFGAGGLKLSSIVSFGAPMLGWSEVTTKRLVMVAKAFETISEAIGKVTKLIGQHKEVLTISFTVLWVLYMAHGYFQSQGR